MSQRFVHSKLWQPTKPKTKAGTLVCMPHSIGNLDTGGDQGRAVSGPQSIWGDNSKPLMAMLSQKATRSRWCRLKASQEDVVKIHMIYSANGPQNPLYLPVAALHARGSMAPRFGLNAFVRSSTIALSIACTRGWCSGSKVWQVSQSGSTDLTWRTHVRRFSSG